MSTDADEFVKTIGGIRLRHVVVVVMSCGAFMAAVSATIAGYKALGGPIPATRDYVSAELSSVEENVEVLAESLRQTRQIVLSDKWWRLQEKIEGFADQPSTRMMRDQIRRLQRDQADVQREIDALERTQ